jgi:hypothetical protein
MSGTPNRFTAVLRYNPDEGWWTALCAEVPAAITADGAVGCRLEGCTLAHTGTYGVSVRRGCKGCQVVRCHLYDLGAGGVRIGEPDMPADDATETSGTVVDNCHIHDFGEVYPAGVGVLILQSSDNRVSHNEIYDGNYTAISVGWNWGRDATRAHRNQIEANHLHHVLRGMLSDGAGIYGILLNNTLSTVGSGEFTIAAGAGSYATPAAAYSTGSGRYLVTWTRSAAGFQGIEARAVTTTGAIVDPTHDPYQVTGMLLSDPAYPDVAWSAPLNHFLVVWQKTVVDISTTDKDIFGQVLGLASGTTIPVPIGSNFLVLTDTPTHMEDDLYPAVASVTEAGGAGQTLLSPRPITRARP